MKTTKGELRNITSGILHTKIEDVYLFFEEYLGAEGIMTHHLPSARKSIIPILKTKLSDEWFNEEWIKVGLDETIELPSLSEKERKEFWKNFGEYAVALWSNIKDKAIIIQSHDNN